MKKTQPLITLPDPKIGAAPIKITPTAVPVLEEGVPMALCWAIFATSAIILLIQIWNYLG